MIKVEKVTKSYLECNNCENSNQVKNITIGQLTTISIRLCRNCIDDLQYEIVKALHKDRMEGEG